MNCCNLVTLPHTYLFARGRSAATSGHSNLVIMKHELLVTTPNCGIGASMKFSVVRTIPMHILNLTEKTILMKRGRFDYV